MTATDKLDGTAVLQRMLEAATAAFGEHWPEVKRFAEREFKTLAERIVDIAMDVAEGAYDAATGKLLLRMQANVAAQAIAGLTTLTLLMVEDVINRALQAVRDLVETAVRGLLPIPG